MIALIVLGVSDLSMQGGTMVTSKDMHYILMRYFNDFY